MLLKLLRSRRVLTLREANENNKNATFYIAFVNIFASIGSIDFGVFCKVAFYAV